MRTTPINKESNFLTEKQLIEKFNSAKSFSVISTFSALYEDDEMGVITSACANYEIDGKMFISTFTISKEK